jgi:hypothetical protein
MKRVFLIVTLVLLGPLGISALNAPTAMAAQTQPEVTHYLFGCSRYPSIPKSGTSGGLPVYLGNGDAGCLDGIHTCHALGAYNGVQAVECMDIWIDPDGTHVVVSAAQEGYCQNTSTDALVECANVNIPFELYTPNDGHGVNDLICGHDNGECNVGSQGANTWQGNEVTSPATCNGPGSGNEYWMVDLAYGTIEVPGDVTFENTSNEATPHAIICA